MFYLTFHRGGEAAMRYALKQGKTVIGRDPSCDIQLLEDDISRIHTMISWDNGGFVISDNSANGTFVNENRISSHRLEKNDIINIGGWKIKFTCEAPEASKETVLNDKTTTKILKYEAGKKEIVSELLELTVISSGRGTKKYTLSAASIGSSAGNDIVIDDDPYVSGNHCIIKGSGEAFTIKDTGSKNGTYLNGERIDQKRLPQRGELAIGRTTVKFETRRETEKIRPAEITSMGPIIGGSPAIRELFSLLKRVTPSEATICITGESGTGKELVARYIHEAGPRCAMPFTALNCGAIPANLIESEFFGYEKGSFTGAVSQHRGAFEQAEGGTLFLDEVGEMPLELQTRLLRVLENRMIRRIGGSGEIPVNVRIIAATNKDIKGLVREGRFREDLFFRLYIVPIEIPPLRKRKEDIQPLAEHFLSELAPSGKSKRLTDAALNKLLAHDWPGNIRELKNTIQRAVVISKESSIAKEEIIFGSFNAPEIEDKNVLEAQERTSVMSAIETSNGNISKAARRLGIARTTLASMLKKFNVDVKRIKIAKRGSEKTTPS